jgi:RNA polymerase sigma factor (TIGR02999 family)
VTQAVDHLVAAVGHEAPHLAEQLLPLIYDDLRRLAAHRLACEAPGQTLQPTALVHEAYLRLTRQKGKKRWENRAQFFAAASEAMRRILVDEVRHKRSLKKGGKLTRQRLDDTSIAPGEPREDLLAIDDALTELAGSEPVAAQLVQLRYFGGLTIAEAAKLLHISARTANRHWTYARAWLKERLGK